MLLRPHSTAALAAAILMCAPPAHSAGLPASETLLFNVEWRLINAGKANMTWNAVTEAGDRGYQATLHLESTGLVSKLFKVKDDYTSRMRQDLCVVASHLNAEEGRRRRETKVTFDPGAGKASYLEKDLIKNTVVRSQEIDIPACVHDVVGALYYLRTLALEPGQSVEIPMSDGKKSVQARVEAQQREDVRTPAGQFKTIRYEAFLFNGVLFKRNAHLYVWLTEDDRKLPVQIRVRMQFTVGTITLQLAKVDRS